jgi:branched-subunit amino acid transport protein
MSIYLYIAAMALTTYLIRVLPLTLLRKPIKSRFLRSFLHYVPYACLTAMTFPAILSSTASIVSGAAALLVAVVLAYRGKSLLTVSLAASAAEEISEETAGGTAAVHHQRLHVRRGLRGLLCRLLGSLPEAEGLLGRRLSAQLAVLA